MFDTMVVPWEQLNEYLDSGFSAFPIHIKRDGYCFLKSIQKILKYNHQTDVKLGNLKNFLMSSFVDNAPAYKNFFIGGTLDTAVEQLVRYFEEGAYYAEAVDLLISATVNTLNANVIIFQKYRGNVQMMKYMKKSAGKTLHLLFHGEHYQAIIEKQTRNLVECLHIMAVEEQEASSTYSTVAKRRLMKDVTNSKKFRCSDESSIDTSGSSEWTVVTSRKKKFGNPDPTTSATELMTKANPPAPVEKKAPQEATVCLPGANFVADVKKTSPCSKKKKHSPSKKAAADTTSTDFSEITFEVHAYPDSKDNNFVPDTQDDTCSEGTKEDHFVPDSQDTVIYIPDDQSLPDLPPVEDNAVVVVPDVDGVLVIPESQQPVIALSDDYAGDDDSCDVTHESVVFKPTTVRRKPVEDDTSSQASSIGNSSCDTSSYSVVEDFLRQGRRFQEDWYKDIPAVHVDSVPKDIDGICLYAVHCDLESYIEKTSDRRWFVMKTSQKVVHKGRRVVVKSGWCQGSFICQRDRCPFFRTSGQRNETNFTVISKDS